MKHYQKANGEGYKGLFTLALFMLLLVATAGLAEEPIIVDGLYYALNDDNKTVTIYSYDTQNLPTEVTIPSQINYNGAVYPVTAIAIGAFRSCTNLAKVTFPKDSKLTTINIGAFNGCKSLESFTIPGSVTTLNPNIFTGSGLKELTIEDGTADLVIPASFLNSLQTITTVTLPARVTEIGTAAFAGCTSLAEVTFAKKSRLESIAAGALNGCTSLKSFTIPGSVTTLGADMFTGSGINELTIEEGDGKTELAIPIAFLSNNTNIEKVSLPARVTKIGDRAFAGCTRLAEVTIDTKNSKMTSIGAWAFASCESLESFTIPGSVTTLNSYIFTGSGLKELTIEEGSAVLVIPDSFLTGLQTITKVSLPARVTKIGNVAFAGCTSLAEVTIAENAMLTSIGTNAFQNCSSLESFFIPANVTTIGDGAFDCAVTVAKENQKFSAEDGVLFDKYKTILYRCPVTKQGAYIIPQTVEKTNQIAFLNCTKLTSVTIPSKLTKIGNFSFKGCINISDVFCETDKPTNILWEDAIRDFKDNEATIIHVRKDAELCNSSNINATFINDATFKITPSGALTILEFNKETTAELQGDLDYNSNPFLEITNETPVDKVVFFRNFTKGVTATIMLPFGFAAGKNIKGTFHTITKVGPDDQGVWTAKLSDKITDIKANTPYIFSPAEDFTSIEFKDEGENKITLQPTRTINPNGTNGWELMGIYSKWIWQADATNEYGFAAVKVEEDGIEAGEFVLAGKGAWIDPMRCYLTYTGNDNPFTAKAATVFPDRIRVVFPSGNNNEEDNEISTDPAEVVTPVSSVSETEETKVWSFGGTIYIDAQPDMDYSIVDLSGRTIKSATTESTHEELSLAKSGIFIVTIGGKTYKVSVN
ncbi:MAG: leucine-rich repeat domain-containing protein [Bacteroidales bacterium]|nr:leucine-rich repeat domain-containing protein [Bacteroidales bacterium]